MFGQAVLSTVCLATYVAAVGKLSSKVERLQVAPDVVLLLVGLPTDPADDESRNRVLHYVFFKRTSSKTCKDLLEAKPFQLTHMLGVN